MNEADSAPDLEQAVAVERPDAPSPLVLLCDHASNRLPVQYGSLGLRGDALLEHFAWDPGALAVSRRLAKLLDAPLAYGRVSRLVLDVNRDPSDVDSIVETADGAPVPGNRALTGAERARRVAEVYAPYHAAVDGLLSKRKAAGRPSALVAIHTYTPALLGVPRPWHCGIIFDADARLADPLVAALQRQPGLVVGINQPYAASDRVYHTLARHGEAKGNPAVMIEIRNDLVRDADSQQDWAERLAPMLRAAARHAFAAGDSGPPGTRELPHGEAGARRSGDDRPI